MEQCKWLEGCPFYGEISKSKPGLAEVLTRRYCHGDFSGCARYMVRTTVGKERVPRNLQPNDAVRAQRIIASASTKETIP